jgi:hypothetical protein
MAKKKRQKTDGKKHSMGRPSLYKPEYCNLEPYLKHCTAKNALPSKVGYAVFLGVAEDTVSNWGKANPDFLGSLRMLLTIEKHTLINKGLRGLYNSTIAKLILSSNHGLREGTDITTGGDKIQQEPLSLEEMKARIAAAEAEGLKGLDHRSISGGGQAEQGK